jgi:hypothetical protein
VRVKRAIVKGDTRGRYDFDVSEERAPDQYVAYTLYRVDPGWRRLPVEEARCRRLPLMSTSA